MKYNKYLFLILFSLCTIVLYAQDDKKKKYKSKRQTPSMLLEEAKILKEKSPTKAIKLVEEAINQSRRKKSSGNEEAEAFKLLGNIYEQIGQKELALERYLQALNLMQSDIKDTGSKAVIFERMGQLNLELEKDKEAEKYFKNCISYSVNKTLTLLCEEGLADVQLLRRDTLAVAAQLDSIQRNYQLDSLEISRNEARRSQAYIQQNDYSRAAESFQNSINTLPDNNKVTKEEYAPIEKAQKELLAYSKSSNADKIEIRSKIANDAAPSVSVEALVLENLKIAELYETEKNYLDAERFVNVAKNLIDVNTNATVAADVYKKSSELNQRKGKIDLALNDLELYISAKENAIRNLENDLKEQVEIVKGQQQIDIQQRDYDLAEKDKALLQSQLSTQRIIITLLSLVLVASLVFFYFLYKNVKEKRKANQLLLLKSLRTQMNPHFIFNALNSVNNFIAKNDEKAANKFLADFSRLMRKVLDYSQKDFIAFEEEMELNELYLKLEHFRFRDKFDYTFENNATQHDYSLQVPPMLIQPFIENAIWHGLRYKEQKGELKVTVEEKGQHLIVTVADNGIGREKSKSLKTKNQKKYKSTGMENVSRSIALINEVYGKNYEVAIRDLNGTDDSGTVVEIRVPLS